jgi:hypothetical protein
MGLRPLKLKIMDAHNIDGSTEDNSIVQDTGIGV